MEAVNGGTTKTCTAPAGTYICTITGLTNGVTYTLTGYALAGVNKSPGVSFYSVSPQVNRPGRPTNVQLDRSSSSVTVSWTEPTFYTSLSKSYAVYALLENAAVSTGIGTTAPACNTSTTSCTFGPGILTAGSKYNFVVRAIQAKTGGALSDFSSLFTVGVPDAPTLVLASVDDEQSSISWADPVQNGGSAITSYSVRYSDDSGVTWTTFTTSATTNPVTVTGLTNGTSYIYQVAATNVNGTGDWSASSLGVTPIGEPGQLQTGPTLTASDTGTDPWITVAWSRWGSLGAPITNGSAVVSYEVLVWGTSYSFTPAQAGCDTGTACSVTFNSTGTAGTNAGIAYGVGYRPVVRATTGWGSGLYSYQAAMVYPGYVPSTPTGLTIAKVSSTSLSIKWSFPTASSNTGAWKVSNYVYEIYDNATDSLVTSATVSNNVRLVLVSGLTPTTTYYFKVRAKTSNVHYSGWGTSTTTTL
ncbi:MAG: hypothetical protein F2790_00915 [Actinobacteria bacterium]|nr:hypothetical protein [Actinomycetota bacterium]